MSTIVSVNSFLSIDTRAEPYQLIDYKGITGYDYTNLLVAAGEYWFAWSQQNTTYCDAGTVFLKSSQSFPFSKYEVTGPSDNNQSPVKWDVYGSNNYQSFAFHLTNTSYWTKIHTQSGQAFSANETKSYSLDGTEWEYITFVFYRIVDDGSLPNIGTSHYLYENNGLGVATDSGDLTVNNLGEPTPKGLQLAKIDLFADIDITATADIETPSLTLVAYELGVQAGTFNKTLGSAVVVASGTVEAIPIYPVPTTTCWYWPVSSNSSVPQPLLIDGDTATGILELAIGDRLQTYTERANGQTLDIYGVDIYVQYSSTVNKFNGAFSVETSVDGVNWTPVNISENKCNFDGTALTSNQCSSTPSATYFDLVSEIKYELTFETKISCKHVRVELAELLLGVWDTCPCGGTSGTCQLISATTTVSEIAVRSDANYTPAVLTNVSSEYVYAHTATVALTNVSSEYVYAHTATVALTNVSSEYVYARYLVFGGLADSLPMLRVDSDDYVHGYGDGTLQSLVLEANTVHYGAELELPSLGVEVSASGVSLVLPSLIVEAYKQEDGSKLTLPALTAYSDDFSILMPQLQVESSGNYAGKMTFPALSAEGGAGALAEVTIQMAVEAGVGVTGEIELEIKVLGGSGAVGNNLNFRLGVEAHGNLFTEVANITLPALACIGSQHYDSVDVNIPMPGVAAGGGILADFSVKALELSATGSIGTSAESDEDVPMFALSGRCGIIGSPEIGGLRANGVASSSSFRLNSTLPALTSSAICGAIGSVTTKRISSGGTGYTVAVLKADITIPSIGTEAVCGASSAFDVPDLSVEAIAFTGAVGVGANIELSLSCTANGVSEVLGSCIVELPNISELAKATVGTISHATLVLPIADIWASAIQGRSGAGDVNLSKLTVKATSYNDLAGEVDITIPHLVAKADGTMDSGDSILRYDRDGVKQC